MTSAKDWLAQMLAGRQLDRPDGRMLFQYRLTQAEYGTLREVLAAASTAGLTDAGFLKDREACALFVMYASEWWRREYAGGAWRWTPIVQSFAKVSGVIPPMDRTNAIIRGISYWRHLPGSEGKKYFGVLVAHGGLPMRLISQGGGKVSAVLSSALRLALRYRWDEANIQAAIAERAEELIHHLRHEEIYSLMARMVSTVLELKREFGLNGVTNPVSLLDTKDSSWRERFPLAVDDAVAQQLLVGLVQEASQQSTTAGSGEFRVERNLRPVTDQLFEISSLVRHPRVIDADVLASIFGLNSDAVPRYFTIDAQVGDRQPLCDGRQVLGADSATVSLAARHPHWRGEAACQEHLLLFRGPTGDLTEGPIAIPGGATISPDEPWVFVRRDEQLLLASTGNARIPEEEVVLIYPSGWRIELIGPNSVVRPLGHCLFKEIRLEVVSVVGDVRVVDGSTAYRVRTAQSTSAPDQYVWEGRRLPYQASPWPVFLGPPKLYCHSADGERTRVNLAQLQWHTGGQPDQRVVDAAHARGPLDVWLVKDGERHTRFRIIVLEPAARIAFSSGATESEGAVTLVGWRHADASVLGDRCAWAASKITDGVRIDLKANGSPPQSVNLLVKWPGSVREVRLPLPFPATGGRFFDGHGDPIPRDSRLSFRNIAGVRMRVFDHNPQAPKKYRVRLTLEVPHATGRVPRLESEHDIPLLRDGTGEMRLLDLQTPIQRLMGFSDELDAGVYAALYAGTTSVTRIHVTRYDATLVKDGATWRLTEEDLALLDSDSLRRVQLCARPIAHADGDTIRVVQSESEGVPTGLWSVLSLKSPEAPWLLFPAADSTILFRPVLWMPAADLADPLHEQRESCALGQAMKLGDPEIRASQIAQVIEDMSVDFAHPSWTLLESNLAALRHLPLNCLDTWRVIARSPAAAVACVLRLGCSESELAELVGRLRDELGFVWELTSFDMWNQSAKRIRPYYAQLLGEDLCAQVFPSFLRSRVTLLSTELPALSLPIQLTLLDAGVEPTQELIDSTRQIRGSGSRLADDLWKGADSLAQRLLFRAHSADADWPNLGLVQPALSGFQAAVSEATWHLVHVHAKSLFWLPDGQRDHKFDIANVPVVCALWSVTAAPLDWWTSSKDKSLALKRIRAFDPLWFEASYRQAVLACLAMGIVQPTTLHPGMQGKTHDPSKKVRVVKSDHASQASSGKPWQ
jgi:hypothetical protein